jgi:hypothetical protein
MTTQPLTTHQLTPVQSPTTAHSFVDCNGNGLDDIFDLELKISADKNKNGIPDECDEGIIPHFTIVSIGVIIIVIVGIVFTATMIWKIRSICYRIYFGEIPDKDHSSSDEEEEKPKDM